MYFPEINNLHQFFADLDTILQFSRIFVDEKRNKLMSNKIHISIIKHYYQMSFWYEHNKYEIVGTKSKVNNMIL
jgi:hypothetical protein